MKQLLKQDVFPYIPFYSRRTVVSAGAVLSAPHNHDFYEVFIVEEGPLQHHINGRVETLYPDTLILVQPSDYHFFSCKDNITARFFNLAFGQKQFEQAQELVALCAPKAVVAPLADKVTLPHELSRLLLRRMKWLQDVSDPKLQEVQHTEGITLLTDILVLCAVGSDNANVVPYWLRKACSEMHRPDNLSLGIPRLVELSGKTQEHLTRSMRKYMGQTPSAYVNAIRLERAAELLVTSQRTVFDVMLDVGFQNTSYFNKLFKEKYLVSPRKYRAEAMAILGKAE